MFGNWAAAGGRGTSDAEGARGRAHRTARGAGRTAPSTPWTGRTTPARRPPGSQPLGRHAGLPSAVFFLECAPRRLQTSPATTTPHSMSPPANPGNVLPRCQGDAASTEGNRGAGPSKQPAPFSRHLSLGALAPRLLCPTGVSGFQTAPFSSQPTQGACRESRPGTGVPPSGSRRAVVAEVNRARVGEGGRVVPLPLPVSSSSSRGGFGAWRAELGLGSESPGCARGWGRGLGKSPGPGAGARGSRCRARSLGAGRCSLG